VTMWSLNLKKTCKFEIKKGFLFFLRNISIYKVCVIIDLLNGEGYDDT
jgi:hypothetical protein